MRIRTENPVSKTRADTDSAIVVESVRKAFGDVQALRGISFSAPAGSVLGVLGPNGAGKTTMVSVLSTLIRPDAGRALVAGHDVVREAARVRSSIMLTGQYAALDEVLTGRENLVLFGRLMGLRPKQAKDRAVQLLEQFELTDAADRRVGQYSGGMRRRIDIACGLVRLPKVVFLDEPTTGLDPASRQRLWSLVRELKQQGVTILLTTQYLEEADALSDNIIVVDKGTVIAEGTADQLKARSGASYCEVVPVDAAEVPAVLTALRGLEGVTVAESADRVALPAPDGAATLGEVLRRVTDAGIDLIDIALRRPSLDEVFLELTRPAEPVEAGA
ncbi:ATP-binding cassette domain-containing protein [Nocardia terpenica]|nr:ATP-binding cassette domain-containing protein [Nocardia terpenica]MBF6061638.1 ATP-binding cassette domain-containing protein [Nocardia terpenica]MBF6107567.1 ATP-binding cassette domain-containing protein [Nocardia terpenica]MBF6110058.1 ATP-binding cassette domain-containing protein [Nocardia terpenica]MBF6122430.1 ATP-binding cassette domain-containing protein [Nocardia terpenica]MBF6151394.1 ATP-binding cassette domain-containing protein [Nocardia terpenica]